MDLRLPGGVGLQVVLGPFFSTLDLANSCWQVQIAEKDWEQVALVQMPFGLNNVLATFRRLMKLCLGDLNYICLLIYLDDIIIFSAKFRKHLKRVDQVLGWNHG